jgi:hypothetical protein
MSEIKSKAFASVRANRYLGFQTAGGAYFPVFSSRSCLRFRENLFEVVTMYI